MGRTTIAAWVFGGLAAAAHLGFASPPAAAQTGEGPITVEGGLCLDVHAPDIARNGGRVQVWGCNGEPQQRWRHDAATGAIVNAGGLCLDVHAPDINRNGGRVQVWTCNGSAQQSWAIDEDAGRIRVASGLCLDVHAPDRLNNGGRVQVWACNGEAQQRWRIGWVFQRPWDSDVAGALPTLPPRLYQPGGPIPLPDGPEEAPMDSGPTFVTDAVIEARPSPPPSEEVTFATGATQTHAGLPAEAAFYPSAMFDCTVPRIQSDRRQGSGDTWHNQQITCVGRSADGQAWMLVGREERRAGGPGEIVFTTPSERLYDGNPNDFGRGWNWLQHGSLYRPECSDRVEKPQGSVMPETYRRCVVFDDDGRLLLLNPRDGEGRYAGMTFEGSFCGVGSRCRSDGTMEGGFAGNWRRVPTDDYHWAAFDLHRSLRGGLRGPADCFSFLDANRLEDHRPPLWRSLWGLTDLETARQATSCIGLFDDGRLRVLTHTDFLWGFSDRTLHGLPMVGDFRWTDMASAVPQRFIRTPDCVVWNDLWNSADIRCFAMVEGGDIYVTAFTRFEPHGGGHNLGRPPGEIISALECVSELDRSAMCFAVTRDNAIYGRLYRVDAPDAGGGWIRLPNPPSPPRSTLSCAEVEAGEFTCAVLGADGRLHMTDVSGTRGSATGGTIFATPWTSIGAPPGHRITSAPECVSSVAPRVDCFVRADDGGLWHVWDDPRVGREFAGGWQSYGSPDGRGLQ